VITILLVKIFRLFCFTSFVIRVIDWVADCSIRVSQSFLATSKSGGYYLYVIRTLKIMYILNYRSLTGVFLPKFFCQSRRLRGHAHILFWNFVLFLAKPKWYLTGLLHQLLTEKWLQKLIWRRPASSYNDHTPSLNTRRRALKCPE